LAEEEEKTKKMDGYTVRWTRKGYKVVDMPVGNFPFNLFEQWKKDCKENFADVRWMKIWHDHELAQFLKSFIASNAHLRDKLEEKKKKEVEKNGGE